MDIVMTRGDDYWAIVYAVTILTPVAVWVLTAILFGK